MDFFVGFHHPGRAYKVGRPVMISHNAIRGRVSDIKVGRWILDSGAFTQITTHGAFQVPPDEYAADIERWSRCGDLEAAVSQDYMCEPDVREICDATVKEQQRKTVQRYDRILSAMDANVHLMPVLQGWSAHDYAEHVEMYADRLTDEMWVGVGSVCKRNSTPADVEMVLSAINEQRPDLRLHGFGIKATALRRRAIRSMLYSADSMAWSYRARRNGGDANSPAVARRFYDELTESQTSTPLFTAT